MVQPKGKRTSTAPACEPRVAARRRKEQGEGQGNVLSIRKKWNQRGLAELHPVRGKGEERPGTRRAGPLNLI